jgi:peptide/nickel transport system substrate-binding protein
MHPQVRFDTQYLTLNTRIPPFDKHDARRAVNYALDRRKFADILGGQDAARPTCQILPPGFPGYVHYCPYAAGTGWSRTSPKLGHSSPHQARPA